MAQSQESIRFDEFITHTQAIFDEMDEHSHSVIVERGGKLHSLKPKARRQRERKGLTEHDSFFQLAGIGSSDEPTNVAEHLHDYLAEAFEEHS